MRRASQVLALALGALAAVTAAACGGDGEKISALPGAPAKLDLTSPAFADGAQIPDRYTCDGDDVSPPLEWSGIPKGTSSLALVLADPDAPGGTFVHWTVFDLDPELARLAEGDLPAGAAQGENSFGKAEYGGPCPPEGDEPHGYEFAIYSLRAKPDLKAGASPEDVSDEIEKLALARGTLSARFGR